MDPRFPKSLPSGAARGAAARLGALGAAAALWAALLQSPSAAHASVMSHGGEGFPLLPPSSLQAPGAEPASPTQLTIAALALAQLGRGRNGPNTIDGGDFGDSSALPNAWCAEFAAWVWGSAGISTAGLDGWAGSFLSYGEQHHSYRPSGPRVGDAVVFALDPEVASAAARGALTGIRHISHVGLVVDVSGSTVTVVNGDWGNGHGGVPLVRVSKFPLAQSDAGDFATGTGQYVAGYVAPVAAGQ